VLATKNIANFEQYAFQDIPENDGKTDDDFLKSRDNLI
jgi:hypothetical protein